MLGRSRVMRGLFDQIRQLLANFDLQEPAAIDLFEDFAPYNPWLNLSDLKLLRWESARVMMTADKVKERLRFNIQKLDQEIKL